MSESYSGTLNAALYTSGETIADNSLSAGGDGPGEPSNGFEPSSDSNLPATMNDTTAEQSSRRSLANPP